MNAKVILLGGNDEKERNDEIKKLVKNKIIDAGSTNTVREFASIINICNLIVSSDTLAMHISIALRKKLIVLMGPTSSAEIELFGRGIKITSDMDCLCCYKKKCDIVPNCMDNISLETVIESVRKLLK